MDPLVATPPSEVPLRDAPLVRVIAQLRFPEILSVEKRDFVAPFQEAIRETYPVLRQEQAQLIHLGAGNGPTIKAPVAWRFNDASGSWRVSLTPGFVALETTAYTSRTDFFTRLAVVAKALEEHIKPGQLDRVGVRYIDRITGEAIDMLSTLVRPEVRGIAGTPAATHASNTIFESVFELPDDRVVARWGVLAPGTTVDPATIEPVNERSWVLDLDMSSKTEMPFLTDLAVEKAQRYAERIYTIFRWAVTDEFLARYGGEP